MKDYDRYTRISNVFFNLLKGFILGVLACILFGLIFGHSGKEACGEKSVIKVKRDTIVMYDTVSVRMPAVKAERIVGDVKIPVTALLPRQEEETDSIIATDSVSVPITQKMYEDSCYKAWVSGYMVSLDSIEIYGRTLTVTERIKIPPQRVRFGLQGGVGMTPKGVQPYIGIGFSVVL